MQIICNISTNRSVAFICRKLPGCRLPTMILTHLKDQDVGFQLLRRTLNLYEDSICNPFQVQVHLSVD